MSEDTAGTASRDSELDASLLNGHLEWLVKVGFSIDKILEWATKEKSKSEDSAHLSPSEESESTLTVSVARRTLVTDYQGDDPVHMHDEAAASEDPDPDDSLDLSPPLFQDSDDILDSQSHSGSQPMKQVRVVTPKRTSQPNGKRKLSANGAASTGHTSKKARPTEDAGSIHSGIATTPQARQQRVRMKEKMKEVIQMLKATPAAEPYINFDECKLPNYDDIIKYPMCLNEIRDRINRNQCDSREIFCSEFDAIIKNCQKYHADNPERLAQARQLKHKFDELVKRYLPDDSHLDALDEGLRSDTSSDDEEVEDSEDTTFLCADRSYDAGEQGDGPLSQNEE